MHEIFNKLQFCANTDFSLDLSGKVYKTVLSHSASRLC